ncbi:uncharacterized protein LOC119666615 [Teleopsis dalmanni]|uniref:uncharacterized protein LOC119666557 n=1 Tax=Teleopsis dalmanni TaxID=139649 RepID=UPI0018CDEDCF|nr:uncharacterized protein LOC119666557 [Teleopsis dalmanni]XP_037931826.1 uncharacterized protein LOC119666615 [Teleopsis dalmanni]
MIMATPPENFIIKTEITEDDFECLMQRIDVIEAKLNKVLEQQEELGKMLFESNTLLRRNLEICDGTPQRFPLQNDKELQDLEEDLKSEKKHDIVVSMRQVLCGSIKNIERILGKSLISSYNYDGFKGKKALKIYKHFMLSLYEAVKKNGYSSSDFQMELRSTLRKIKNKYQKRHSRQM